MVRIPLSALIAKYWSLHVFWSIISSSNSLMMNFLRGSYGVDKDNDFFSTDFLS